MTLQLVRESVALRAADALFEEIEAALAEAADGPFDPGYDVEIREDLDGHVATDRDVNHLAAISYALKAGLPVIGWGPAQRNPGTDERIARAGRQFTDAAAVLIAQYQAGSLTSVQFSDGLAASYLRQAQNAFTAGKRALGNLQPLTVDDQVEIRRTLASVGLDASQPVPPGSLGATLGVLVNAEATANPAAKAAVPALNKALADSMEARLSALTRSGFARAAAEAEKVPVDAILTRLAALEAPKAAAARRALTEKQRAQWSRLQKLIAELRNSANARVQAELARVRRAVSRGNMTPGEAAVRLQGTMQSEGRRAYLRARAIAGGKGPLGSDAATDIADQNLDSDGIMARLFGTAPTGPGLLATLASQIFNPSNIDPQWLWHQIHKAEASHYALEQAGERAAFRVGEGAPALPPEVSPAATVADIATQQNEPVPAPTPLGQAVMAWWTLGDAAEHCRDCLSLAEMSPYFLDKLDAMNLHPGSGHTRCGFYCRCHLEYDVPTDVCADSLVPDGSITNSAPGLSIFEADPIAIVGPASGCRVPMPVESIATDPLPGQEHEQAAFSWDTDIANRIELGKPALNLPKALDFLDHPPEGAAPFIRPPGEGGVGPLLVQHFNLDGSDFVAAWQEDGSAARFLAGTMVAGSDVLEPEFTAAAVQFVAQWASERGLALEFDQRLVNPGMSRFLDELGATRATGLDLPPVRPGPEAEYSFAEEAIREAPHAPLPEVPPLPVMPEFQFTENVVHVSNPAGVIQKGFAPSANREEALRRLHEVFPKLDKVDASALSREQMDSITARGQLFDYLGIDRSLWRDFTALPEDSVNAGQAAVGGIIRLKPTAGLAGIVTQSNTFGDLFAHEYGHQVMRSLESRLGHTRFLDFLDRFNEANVGRLSHYADESPNELFGEAFAIMTKPDYEAGRVAMDGELWDLMRESGLWDGRKRVPDVVFPDFPTGFDNLLADPETGALQKGWSYADDAITLDSHGSEARLLRDPQGALWMIKPNTSTEEVAGSRAVRLFGFNAPPVARIKYGDEWMSLQPIIPNVESYARRAPSMDALSRVTSREEVRDLWGNGLVDYVIANTDGHGGNYLFGQGRVWAIDKGLAFYDLGTINPVVREKTLSAFRSASVGVANQVQAPEMLLRMKPEDVRAVLDRFDAVSDDALRSAITETVYGREVDLAEALRRKHSIRAQVEEEFRHAVDNAGPAGRFTGPSDEWLAWRKAGGTFEAGAVPDAMKGFMAVDEVPWPKASDLLAPKASGIFKTLSPQQMRHAWLGLPEELRAEAEATVRNVLTVWKKDVSVVPTDWQVWLVKGGTFTKASESLPPLGGIHGVAAHVSAVTPTQTLEGRLEGRFVDLKARYPGPGDDVQFQIVTGEHDANAFKHSAAGVASGSDPGTVQINTQHGAIVRTQEDRDKYAKLNASGGPSQANQRLFVADSHGRMTVVDHEWGHVVQSWIVNTDAGKPFRAEADAVAKRAFKDPPSGYANVKSVGLQAKNGESFAEVFAAVEAGEPDRWGMNALLDKAFPDRHVTVAPPSFAKLPPKQPSLKAPFEGDEFVITADADKTLVTVAGSDLPLNADLAEWSGHVPVEPPLPDGVLADWQRKEIRAKGEAAWHSWNDVKDGAVDYAITWSGKESEDAAKAGLHVRKLGDGNYYAAATADRLDKLEKAIAGGLDTGSDGFWTDWLGYSRSRLDAIDEWERVRKGSHSLRAGVVLVEPDGRMWVIEPRNHFGGYQHTFAKGGVDEGESTAAAAVREAREEMGFSVELDSYVGDFASTDGGSVTRYYVAHRTGGGPAYAKFKETYAVKLGSPAEVRPSLIHNGKVDKRDSAVLDAYLDQAGLPPVAGIEGTVVEDIPSLPFDEPLGFSVDDTLPPAKAVKAAWGEKEYAPVNKKLTGAQLNAVDWYVAEGANVNAALKGVAPTYALAPGVQPSLYAQDVLKKVPALDEVLALHPVAEDIYVTRGMELSGWGGSATMLDPASFKFPVGDVFTFNGYVSTTLDKSLAKDSTSIVGQHTVIVTLRVPKGTGAFYMSVGGGDEAELLLSRGLSYRATSATWDAKQNRWLVDAEIIPPAAPGAATAGAVATATAVPAHEALLAERLGYDPEEMIATANLWGPNEVAPDTFVVDVIGGPHGDAQVAYEDAANAKIRSWTEAIFAKEDGSIVAPADLPHMAIASLTGMINDTPVGWKLWVQADIGMSPERWALLGVTSHIDGTVILLPKDVTRLAGILNDPKALVPKAHVTTLDATAADKLAAKLGPPDPSIAAAQATVGTQTPTHFATSPVAAPAQDFVSAHGLDGNVWNTAKLASETPTSTSQLTARWTVAGMPNPQEFSIFEASYVRVQVPFWAVDNQATRRSLILRELSRQTAKGKTIMVTGGTVDSVDGLADMLKLAGGDLDATAGSWVLDADAVSKLRLAMDNNVPLADVMGVPHVPTAALNPAAQATSPDPSLLHVAPPSTPAPGVGQGTLGPQYGFDPATAKGFLDSPVVPQPVPAMAATSGHAQQWGSVLIDWDVSATGNFRVLNVVLDASATAEDITSALVGQVGWFADAMQKPMFGKAEHLAINFSPESIAKLPPAARSMLEDAGLKPSSYSGSVLGRKKALDLRDALKGDLQTVVGAPAVPAPAAVVAKDALGKELAVGDVVTHGTKGSGTVTSISGSDVTASYLSGVDTVPSTTLVKQAVQPSAAPAASPWKVGDKVDHVSGASATGGTGTITSISPSGGITVQWPSGNTGTLGASMATGPNALIKPAAAAPGAYSVGDKIVSGSGINGTILQVHPSGNVDLQWSNGIFANNVKPPTDWKLATPAPTAAPAGRTGLAAKAGYHQAQALDPSLGMGAYSVNEVNFAVQPAQSGALGTGYGATLMPHPTLGTVLTTAYGGTDTALMTAAVKAVVIASHDPFLNGAGLAMSKFTAGMLPDAFTDLLKQAGATETLAGSLVLDKAGLTKLADAITSDSLLHAGPGTSAAAATSLDLKAIGFGDDQVKLVQSTVAQVPSISATSAYAQGASWTTPYGVIASFMDKGTSVSPLVIQNVVTAGSGMSIEAAMLTALAHAGDVSGPGQWVVLHVDVVNNLTASGGQKLFDVLHDAYGALPTPDGGIKLPPTMAQKLSIDIKAASGAALPGPLPVPATGPLSGATLAVPQMAGIAQAAAPSLGGALHKLIDEQTFVSPMLTGVNNKLKKAIYNAGGLDGNVEWRRLGNTLEVWSVGGADPLGTFSAHVHRMKELMDGAPKIDGLSLKGGPGLLTPHVTDWLESQGFASSGKLSKGDVDLLVSALDKEAAAAQQAALPPLAFGTVPLYSPQVVDAMVTKWPSESVVSVSYLSGTNTSIRRAVTTSGGTVDWRRLGNRLELLRIEGVQTATADSYALAHITRMAQLIDAAPKVEALRIAPEVLANLSPELRDALKAHGAVEYSGGLKLDAKTVQGVRDKLVADAQAPTIVTVPPAPPPPKLSVLDSAVGYDPLKATTLVPVADKTEVAPYLTGVNNKIKRVVYQTGGQMDLTGVSWRRLGNGLEWWRVNTTGSVAESNAIYAHMRAMAALIDANPKITGLVLKPEAASALPNEIRDLLEQQFGTAMPDGSIRMKPADVVKLRDTLNHDAALVSGAPTAGIPVQPQVVTQAQATAAATHAGVPAPAAPAYQPTATLVAPTSPAYVAPSGVTAAHVGSAAGGAPIIPPAKQLAPALGYDHSEMTAVYSLGSSDTSLGSVTKATIPQDAFSASWVMPGTGVSVDGVFARSPSGATIAFTDVANHGATPAQVKEATWASLLKFADQTATKVDANTGAALASAKLYVTKDVYDANPGMRDLLLRYSSEGEILVRPPSGQAAGQGGKFFDAYGAGIRLNRTEADKLAAALKTNTEDVALQGQVLAAIPPPPTFTALPAGVVANQPVAILGSAGDQLYLAGSEVIRAKGLRAVSSWAGGNIESEWLRTNAILQWTDFRVAKGTVAEVKASAARTLDSLLENIASTPGAVLEVDSAVWNALPDVRDLLLRYNGVQATTASRSWIRLSANDASKLRQDMDAELGALAPAGTNLKPVVEPPIWPAPQDLTEVPVGALGGQGEKKLFKDAQGNEWLFKTGDGAHVDVAASQLAALLGVRVPPAKEYELMVDGKAVRGSLQKLVPGSKSIPSISSLTPDQTNELMQHTVLDWLVANDDSHVENFLADADGHLWGIDKTRGYVALGTPTDTLDPARGARQGWRTKPLVNVFWQDVRSNPALLKNVSPRAVSRTLGYLESVSDQQFLQIVAPILGDSARFGQFKSADEMRKALLLRKNSVRSDLQDRFAAEIKAAIGSPGGGSVPQEWRDWLQKDGGVFKTVLTPTEVNQQKLSDLYARFGIKDGSEITPSAMADLLSPHGTRAVPGRPSQTALKKAHSLVHSMSGNGVTGSASGEYGAEQIAYATAKDAYQYVSDVNQMAVLAATLDPAFKAHSWTTGLDEIKKAYNPDTGKWAIVRNVKKGGSPDAYFKKRSREGFRSGLSSSLGFTGGYGSGQNAVLMTMHLDVENFYASSYVDPSWFNAGTGEREIVVRDLQLAQVVRMNKYGFDWRHEAQAKGIDPWEYLRTYSGPVVTP